MPTSPAPLALCLGLCLGLLGGPAEAQQGPPALSRTLSLSPRAGSPPGVHLTPRLATTLEVDFPLREARLEGPGAQALLLRRLEPQVLALYASRALEPAQRPTLTLEAEDGTSHTLWLATGGPADVKVHVRQGACVRPEDATSAGARLLLEQDPSRLRESRFLWHTARGDAPAQLVGSLALARLALLVLKLEPSFTPGALHLEGPSGPARVLGMGPLDGHQQRPVLVERPPGDAQGLSYTLTLEERDGPRRVVLPPLSPWPRAPLLGQPVAGHRVEGDADVHHGDGQLAAPQPGAHGR